MLRNYHVPRKLRTIHYPGQQIELWLNEKRVYTLDDVIPKERPFLEDFIENLEEQGWTVLIQP